PFVSEVISPSSEATYLAGESAHYPTAVLDVDGNERASISLRNTSLNIIQLLLDQLMHKRLDGRARHAALEGLFQILGRVRVSWNRSLVELNEDLKSLRAIIDAMQRVVDSQAKQKSDEQARRQVSRLESMRADERGYADYAA